MDDSLKSQAARLEHRGSLGIVCALRACVGGIRFIVTTPATWPYAAVPIGMMAVLTCGFSLLGVWGALQASHHMLGQTDSFWGHAGSRLVTGLLIIPALVLAVILGLSLAQPLSGFALEAISRQQERALTGTVGSPPAFTTALWTGLKMGLFTFAVGIFVFVPLFLLNLMFPPAAIVTVPLKIAIASCLLAWDFLDYPLSLRGLGLRARLRWARRNVLGVTGFGLAWTLLAFVPGTALLLLPMGVAGATRLVVEDERS